MSETLTQDLGGKRVVAKFAPWLLRPQQQERRAAVAGDLFQTVTDEPDFLTDTVTGDESGVFGSDLQAKAQSSQVPWPSTPEEGTPKSQ